MRKIFWDTMLFIYMFDGTPEWRVRVIAALSVSRERKDLLFTSYLALGELIAGIAEEHRTQVSATLAELGFQFLNFGAGAVEPFGRLRGRDKVPVADAIHLACAGAEGMDLFLTEDKRLLRLHVPGVKFISNLNAFVPAV